MGKCVLSASGSGQGAVVGSCEHSNELSGFIHLIATSGCKHITFNPLKDEVNGLLIFKNCDGLYICFMLFSSLPSY
jgi:hypothetical protein